MAETLPEAQHQFTTSISSQEFEILPPLACAWTQEQKHLILERGTKLLEGQMADARHVGVSYPERVRLLKVKRIQLPENHALREAASVIGLLSPDTSRAGPGPDTTHWKYL